MDFGEKIAERKNKVIYRNGDKLIKLFDESFAVSGILNEALNHERILETGLCIPSFQEVAKAGNKWMIAMDYIDGKTIEQLILENPHRQDEYLDIFVRTQLEIHSKRSMLLRKLHDKMEWKIESSNLDSSVKFDLKTRLAGLKKHNKVLHGDYQLSNVIIDNTGKVFVIDWSHATQGNASADVAMSYLLMKMDGRHELAEKYLDLFCEKTETDKRYVLSWLPIVAVSYLEKCSPENKAMLESFINVVEY